MDRSEQLNTLVEIANQLTTEQLNILCALALKIKEENVIINPETGKTQKSSRPKAKRKTPKTREELLAEMELFENAQKKLFQPPNESEKKDQAPEIDVEDNDESFILKINGSRSFFTLDEMRTIVKISHSVEKGKAILRLFTWLENNRSDVLYENNIRKANDLKIDYLYEFIINNYITK